MKKFTATDKGEQYITYAGKKYAFIVRKNQIGIRRMDQKDMKENIVNKITEYLISEGFTEHLIDKEENDFQ